MISEMMLSNSLISDYKHLRTGFRSQLFITKEIANGNKYRQTNYTEIC